MPTLYFGDNLDILRDKIGPESIDLIYLDPPFNSKRNYNLLFRTPKGHESDAQITAFEDSWQWGDQAEREFEEILKQPNTSVAEMIRSFRQFLKTPNGQDSDIMAYLVMMASRLLEMHRVLKSTGSLYLHCDPTASHYLRIILDAVFGLVNFQNEIVWKRTNAHNDPKKYGNVHDVLFYYSKTKNYLWNPQYTPYSQKYIETEWHKLPSGRFYKAENMTDPRNKMAQYDFMGTTARWRTNHDGMMKLWNACQTEVPNSHGLIKLGKDGKPILRCRIIFMDELPGVPLQSWWDDITSLRGGAIERLGYPTQKPLALLERIISASSPVGGIVCDPFCGCGTAVHAAQKLGRDWIGIDITHLAVKLIEKRMREAFPDLKFKVEGTPRDIDGARDLAFRDKYQFQFWACALVGAQPYRGGKRGADSGIDGVIFFQDDVGAAKKAIVSVKGGEHVTRTMVADLKNTVDREKAQIGFFVTLVPPTQPMITEAVSAGFYESPHSGAFPKVQILTIEGLVNGTESPKYPDMSRGGLTFKKTKVEDKGGTQGKLF